MTRATKRPSAARLAIQLAMLATLGSAISGGCSSGVKTVPGDCGGTGALGGAGTVNGGASAGVSAGALGIAADAGQGQAGADGGEGGSAPVSSQGGESGDSPGNAGSSAGGHGGSAGTAGHSGSSSSGGMSNAGGHGGSAGHAGSAGNSTGGQAAAVCGDKVTTPPEFCDDGTNTDLSYGCVACTTLPAAAGGASQGGAASVPEQCDECLQKDSKPTSCFGCVDYRACYACLRRQPDSFDDSSTFCNANARDDDPAAQSSNPKSYSDRCFDPTNSEYKAATGGPAGSEPKGLVCQALVACALRTGCVLGPGPTMFSNCYCGVVPHGTTCVDPTFVPNGPCANEIRDADAPGASKTGSALTLEISTNIATIDPGAQSSALGIAYQISNCAADTHGCADVCFPNSSSTGGAGGTAGTAGVGGGSGHGGS
jgi:hypothetical protein